MRTMVAAVMLCAVIASAGDGGTKAPPPAAADAGTAAALPPGVTSATAVFLIVENQEDFAKLEAVAPKDRASFKGLVTKMQIGKHYYGAIFVDGYTLPRSRRVGLSADLTILAPNGDARVERVSAANAKTCDPKLPSLFMRPTLPMTWGLTDAEGEYTVRLKLFDEVRGESSESHGTFTLVR